MAIFDEIDLSELANSEGPTIKKDDITVKATPVDNLTKGTQDTPQDKQKKPEEQKSSDDVEIDFLANLEETVSEEEVETDQGTTASQAPANKGNNSSSRNAYTSLASALIEAGVFSSLSEEEVSEIDSADLLLDRISQQIKVNEYAGLTEDQKQYLEAMRTGIPHHDYAQAKSNATQYRSITNDHIAESPEIQYELIRRQFLSKGFDEKKAAQYASLAANSSTALEEAISARDLLASNEEARINKELEAKNHEKTLTEKKRTEELESLKSKVNESREVIPGVNVNASTKDRIFESMTNIVKMDGDRGLNEVMDKYKNDLDYKLRLHALDVITKGFTDFSKIVKTSKTKALKELDETLKNGNTLGSVGSPASRNSGTLTGQTTRQIAKSLQNLKLPGSR